MLTAYGLSHDDYRLCMTKHIPGYVLGYATVKDGLKYIVYDQTKVSRFSHAASLQLVAHELGHHFHGHLHNSHSSIQEEREAEQFSGRTFSKLGYSLKEATHSVPLTFGGTITHPSGGESRKIIRKGWLAAKTEYDQLKTIRTVTAAHMKTHNLEESIYTVNQFITALGNRSFKRAYDLQRIRSWGTIDEFSSTQSFGGIVQTKILSAPEIIEFVHDENTGYIRVKIFIQYFARDPVNDKCTNGAVYNQYFWVEGINQKWRICKAKLKGTNCQTYAQTANS